MCVYVHMFAFVLKRAYMYNICMYIYGHPPPKIYTRLFRMYDCTGCFPVLVHDYRHTESTVNIDIIVPFAMCIQTALLYVAGLICV